MTNTTCPYHMCTKQRKSTVSNLISLDLYFCRQIELIVSPEFEDNSPSYHYDLATHTYGTWLQM